MLFGNTSIMCNCPAKSIEKDGGLVITQTEKSNIEMTDEQLAGIVEIIRNIRNKLILNN